MLLFLPTKLSDDQVLALATAASKAVDGPEQLAICDFYRQAYEQFWTLYVQHLEEAFERMWADELDNWDDEENYGIYCCIVRAMEGMSLTNKCRIMGIPARYDDYVPDISYSRVYDVEEALCFRLRHLGLGVDAALGIGHSPRFAWVAAVARTKHMA
jgi:hypothetical protein